MSVITHFLKTFGQSSSSSPSDGHHLLPPGGAEPHIALLDSLHPLELRERPQRLEAPSAQPHHLEPDDVVTDGRMLGLREN